MPTEKQLSPDQALKTIRNICLDSGNTAALKRVKDAIALWFTQQPALSPNITVYRTDAELLTSALDTILDVSDGKVTLG